MAIFSKQDPVEEAVQRLLKLGRVTEVESELQKFRPSRLSGKQRESWYLYWGIAAFRRGDRAEAFARFSEGHDACPRSEQIAFSLGQEYEARGEPDRMLKLFKACTFPRVSAQRLLTAARYCYLWNMLDHASGFLEPIRAAYFQLGIADDHFLFMRGLPFFGQTWSCFLCFSVVQGDLTNVEKLTVAARQKLKDFGFSHLEVMLRCYRNRSFSEKIEALADDLRNTDPNVPQGYSKTQLACLRAVATQDPVEAGQHLDAVSLGAQDFSWLGDVLLVHRAWLAGRANRNEEEERLLNQFFTKQPLLLEPDHAANFALIPYQEKLKIRYQSQRRY
jgi:hypothetical protein